MTESLFTKIINREIPADWVYEDDDIVGFVDINPQAPIHVLFVPRVPIATINDIKPDTIGLIGKLHLAAIAYAKKQGFADDGYRLVINCNENGGQSVYHIHLHLLAGRRMVWPPG